MEFVCMEGLALARAALLERGCKSTCVQVGDVAGSEEGRGLPQQPAPLYVELKPEGAVPDRGQSLRYQLLISAQGERYFEDCLLV